jgi:hypothetical protein
MSLTFAGEAAESLAYPAYNALKNIAPTFAALAEAAEAAAVAAAVADGALVLGAGLAGYAIGQAILAQLRETPPVLPSQNAWKGGNPGTQIRVLAHSVTNATGRTDFDNVFNSPIVCPIFRYNNDGTYTAGVLAGDPLVFVGYVSGAPSAFSDFFTIDSVETVGGGPNPSLFKTPTPVLKPVPEVPKLPAIVPFPGYPDGFPITPTVVPNPNNNPDGDDTATQPGIMVKIPETGQQFEFTPTGVRIGKYTAPETKPYEIPQVPPPPTTPKVATEPCPCPDSKVDLTEVICRLKALEDGLLNDGYEYTVHTGGSGQGAVVTGISDELVYVEIQVTTVAPSERTQRSAPGTPTVYFIGWFSWMIGNFPSERTNIGYLNHNFIAPPNATGYLYSLHDFCAAESRYITRKPKDYNDAC